MLRKKKKDQFPPSDFDIIRKMPDILSEILSYIDRRSYLKAILVCKDFYAAAKKYYSTPQHQLVLQKWMTETLSSQIKQLQPVDSTSTYKKVIKKINTANECGMIETTSYISIKQVAEDKRREINENFISEKKDISCGKGLGNSILFGCTGVVTLIIIICLNFPFLFNQSITTWIQDDTLFYDNNHTQKLFDDIMKNGATFWCLLGATAGFFLKTLDNCLLEALGLSMLERLLPKLDDTCFTAKLKLHNFFSKVTNSRNLLVMAGAAYLTACLIVEKPLIFDVVNCRNQDTNIIDASCLDRVIQDRAPMIATYCSLDGLLLAYAFLGVVFMLYQMIKKLGNKISDCYDQKNSNERSHLIQQP